MKLKELAMTVDLQSQIVKYGKELNTKLAYAYKNKNMKAWQDINKRVFNDPIEEKKLDLAIVGTNKELLFDEKGNYKYTKESFKELKKFEEELWETEVDFEMYATKFSDLSEKEKEAFIKDGVFANSIDEEVYTALSRFISELPELKLHEETV